MTEPKSDFSDAALGADADRALSALDEAGARAIDLVNAWIKANNAAAIAETAERAKNTAAKKAARRGLNVLKSRGIKIPERKKTASLTGPKSEESYEAWMMPPDTAGSTLIVITSHAPASRYRAVFTIVHRGFGVQRVDIGEVSQSQLRESMTRALPGAQYRPIKIPVEWARSRIAEARKRHAERGVPEPLGFSSAKSLLEPLPASPPTHPFDDEGLELADEDAREMAKESAALHALPEFRGWFPTRAAVEEMLAKVGETVTPGEQPDPDEMRKKLEAEVVAATDRYFSPERRADLVASMKDSGLSILARDGEQKALELAAVIKSIENCGLITDPPHEIGFLKGFFDKAVSLLLAQGGGSLRIPVPARKPEALAEPESKTSGP